MSAGGKMSSISHSSRYREIAFYDNEQLRQAIHFIGHQASASTSISSVSTAGSPIDCRSVLDQQDAPIFGRFVAEQYTITHHDTEFLPHWPNADHG